MIAASGYSAAELAAVSRCISLKEGGGETITLNLVRRFELKRQTHPVTGIAVLDASGFDTYAWSEVAHPLLVPSAVMRRQAVSSRYWRAGITHSLLYYAGVAC